MYLNFFGLREQPFGVTPDPRFLYLSAAHREAIASLYYGIEAGRGFLGLIAKPGMGKTTILFHLLEKFRSTARTAFIFQTQCTSREFLRFLLVELGYQGDTQDFVRLHEEFNKRLVQEARAGNRFIVVIDEAQNLDASVLETVRLLSDFETPRAKLLTIILAGQPELAGKLASPGLSQLRQRISIVNRVEPLPSWEIKNYIEHRLKVAGYEGDSIFNPEALEQIATFTEGIPRNVNNFCFNALSLACALRQKTVDLAVAQEVISDLDISKHLLELPQEGVSSQPSGLPAEVLPRSSQVAAAPVGHADPAAKAELPGARKTSIAQNNSSANEYRSKSSARGGNGTTHSNGQSRHKNGQNGRDNADTLSPAEAREFMRSVTTKLKNWQASLESAPVAPLGTGDSEPE